MSAVDPRAIAAPNGIGDLDYESLILDAPLYASWFTRKAQNNEGRRSLARRLEEIREVQ